jgi:hypothetical protein
MSEKKQKTTFNLGVIVGLAGFIAGIFLILGEDWITGLFGSIASAGLAYMSYKNSKEVEK